MRGMPTITSRVEKVAQPRCYLYRTNAGAVGRVMAAIDDELAQVKASLDSIQTGVSALLAKIAAMPTAGLTPEQQAALDAINTEAQAIATAANPAPAAP